MFSAETQDCFRLQITRMASRYDTLCAPLPTLDLVEIVDVYVIKYKKP